MPSDQRFLQNRRAFLGRTTGALGSIADLPPAAVQELKELGLYELFASHENMNVEQVAADEQALHEKALRREAPHSRPSEIPSSR